MPGRESVSPRAPARWTLFLLLRVDGDYLADMNAAADVVLDCIIIGAGPAGLTAATYLARSRRTFALIDGGESRARWIPTSHNIPGFPQGVTGEALLARMRAETARYGATTIKAQAEGARRVGEVFHVTAGGRDLRAHRLILATGIKDREPERPDEARVFDAVKKGLIRICPVCDGYESAGLAVGVLGSCEHAAAEALFLRTYTDRITVIVPESLGRVSDERRRDLAGAGIALVEVEDRSLLIHGSNVGSMAIGGHEHRFDVVYAALGSDPRNALAEQLGAALGDDGRLTVDDHCRTSLEGVYAAGDLVRGLNQVVVACGEAAQAAIAVHNSLPRNYA